MVDIDLEKFFDRIGHDRLIHRMRQKIKDPRILRLVGLTLRSGILKDGLVTPSLEGSVQGSPLSPLLSNIVLDELDHELEKRGLAFCRYADDCNIFVASPKAAQRVMEAVSRFIEEKLKLNVNRQKSKVALSRDVKFLGMTILPGKAIISKASLKKAFEKVKELTRRGTSINLQATMERINTWYEGWASYYKMTWIPSQLGNIEAHIRRRLRMRIIAQQKRKRHLYETLRKRGVSSSLARRVFTNRKRWYLSHSRAVERAYSNAWFIHTLGQKIVSNQNLPHWRVQHA